ncbi:MAG: 30S ribosomal protein S4 [Nitrospirae bacterium]|nr:30S ribosomal protein S4 [Nitrospirota bacterium]
MARYIGAVCRLCRREGTKLFLKGNRCLTEKCAIDRRSYAPGQHGQKRTKTTEYQAQLREKQKVKRIYGVLERQFRGYFDKAARKKGITGEQLLQMLDRRLDSVVYRMGFTASRNESRQFVRHGHVQVNGKKVNIPSYLVDEGDVIRIREKSRTLARVQENMEALEGKSIPSYIEVDKAGFSGRVVALPSREDVALPVSEQLIVELYSK